MVRASLPVCQLFPPPARVPRSSAQPRRSSSPFPILPHSWKLVSPPRSLYSWVPHPLHSGELSSPPSLSPFHICNCPAQRGSARQHPLHPPSIALVSPHPRTELGVDQPPYLSPLISMSIAPRSGDQLVGIPSHDSCGFPTPPHKIGR